MSVPRFERDTGDDTPRQRGRIVPIEPDPAGGLLVDIRVNGVTFGTIDPLTLRARAQIDLERVKGALDLLRWCSTHGGVDNTDASRDEAGLTDLDRLEEALADMPLMAVVDLASSISAALGEAMQIPKRRARP